MPVKPPVHRPLGARSMAEVKRALDRERPSAARRGYGSRWRSARTAYVARHPLCAACQAQGGRSFSLERCEAGPREGCSFAKCVESLDKAGVLPRE
jgi:hypothetical protein